MRVQMKLDPHTSELVAAALADTGRLRRIEAVDTAIKNRRQRRYQRQQNYLSENYKMLVGIVGIAEYYRAREKTRLTEAAVQSVVNAMFVPIDPLIERLRQHWGGKKEQRR